MKILISRIPGVIIMYVASILEKTIKEFWQSTFVPCMYKFKSKFIIIIRILLIIVRRRSRRRAVAPTSNTGSHDYHEKIS